MRLLRIKNKTTRMERYSFVSFVFKEMEDELLRNEPSRRREVNQRLLPLNVYIHSDRDSLAVAHVRPYFVADVAREEK